MLSAERKYILARAMKISEKTYYLKTDLHRLFRGYKLYVSIIGVVAALFFSLEDNGIINNSVVTTYTMSTEMSGMMLVYVFCAFAYAISLGEDIENKYVRYQIIRGSKIKYIVSKVFVIYFSSILVMLIGTWFFLLLNRLRAPWVDLDIDDLSTEKAGQYSFLLQDGYYMWYCLLYALQLGLLAGVFSVLAALVSLYISNIVTTLAVPVLVYQVLLEYSGTGRINVFSFRAYNKLFANDINYFIFVLLLSIVPTILLGLGIYKKLNSRL